MNHTLTGRLQKIVFQNSDTGFMIGSFLIDDFSPSTITAKGNMVNPQAGLTYTLTIQEEPANKYGQQYKIISYDALLPMDPHGIFKYITRVCKFVGPTVGGHIVDKFGADTLRVMKEDPVRLSQEINGITLDRAKEIQGTLCENEVNERLMVSLESLLNVPGMHKDLPVKMIKTFKSNAVDTLKENPYIITMFPGIGFILADMVAVQKVGYDPEGIKRKKSVAVHCLREELSATGSTWISERVLIQKMKELVSVPDLIDGLLELKADGLIIDTQATVNQIREKLWALTETDQQETFISGKVSEFICNHQ